PESGFYKSYISIYKIITSNNIASLFDTGCAKLFPSNKIDGRPAYAVIKKIDYFSTSLEQEMSSSNVER
ncbi:MAG: hypothetical protein QX191_00930, partial [Methylococcaceae bacterium]